MAEAHVWWVGVPVHDIIVIPPNFVPGVQRHPEIDRSAATMRRKLQQ